MPPDKICRTIHQYNKGPISAEDMQKLRAIAEDYVKVKNYVYARYAGIGSLSKIYPGYTVQNEMTESGLRAVLGLPSVYFYLAVYDALGDIKSQWTRTKTRIAGLVSKNENFTADEKHYLRFLLKVSNAFDAALNQTDMVLPDEIKSRYVLLAGNVDTDKLHRYLRRQVRKYHGKIYTDRTEGFSIAERAYRYADHGIYISTKEKRKRVFIPLTDNNRYSSQLYIRLMPEESGVEIKAPVYVAVCSHEDYRNKIGVSVGMYTMLTTNDGHCYGEELGSCQTEYADWIRAQTGIYNRNRRDNPGRKKYTARKRRYEEKLHSYINQELNRFLRTEQPETIYIVKLPKPQAAGSSKRINHSVTMWQRGYIRNRLAQKCREQSIELLEVLGKDISRECSRCGMEGTKKEGMFVCEACGYREQEKTNTARNVLKRGLEGRIVKS